MWQIFGMALIGLVTMGDVKASPYSNAKTGEIQGKVMVQWLSPDVFLFIPDDNDPLGFTRSNGKKITPGRMITDGGTIPRPMRAFRNYSPWGYAPAFIVHDWIFHIRRCQIGDFESYTLEEAAMVMAEIIKTMMESGHVEKDENTLNVMHDAVVSVFAEKAWNDGNCIVAPAAFDTSPIFEFLIDFSQ